MSEIHICWSRKDQEKVSISLCPTCKKRRRFYSWFQEWYGWNSTCTGCGDVWTDGEQHDRPFERGWRKENIKQAKDSIKGLKAREKKDL